MTTLSEYFQIWTLKPSHLKTVTTAFYFKNRGAKRELAVHKNNNLLPFCTIPAYLGSKTGQIFHVPSSDRCIAQKTEITCRTAEATCIEC